MLTWNRWLILACSIPYLLSLSMLNTLSALPTTRVLSVEYAVEELQENIIISMSRHLEYRAISLENPDRIVIDLKNCYLPETHLIKAINGNLIKSCRISQNSKDKTRVVLDIKRKAGYNIVSSSESSLQKHTLTVQVTTQTPEKMVSQVQGTTQKLTTELSEPDLSKTIFTNTSSSEHSPWEADEKNDKSSLFSMSGSMLTRFHTDTVHNDSSEINANEDTWGSLNRLIISSAYNDLLTISAKSDYRYAGDRESYEAYDLDLYESYIKYSSDSLSLKLGKQIRRWGKADQFSPVDTLNPEDIREFVTLEYEDRKIPVWMADATWKTDNFSIETLYIPVFEPMQLDYFGSDWAFYTHLKEDIQSNAAVPDSLKPYFEQMGIHETDPDNNGLNGEYGMRISTVLNGWDLGATYHYTWDDQPFFSSFPVKNLNINGSLTESSLTSALESAILTQEMVEVTYVRSNIVGMEFETIISDLGVRGEAAWHDSQPFITSTLVSTERPVFYSIIGADYTGKSNWYLNLQLSYSHISDYEDNILYFKEDTFALLGEINREFFSSWLKTALHYHITFNENQFYLSPRIEYSYIPNLDIIFGLHIFEGSPYNFMGRFDDSDQLFLDLNYHF